MSILDKLERRFRRYAIPHLTLWVLAGQFVYYAAAWHNPQIAQRLWFDLGLVIQGEFWRVITFVFVSPPTHPVLLLFAFYLFYLMGSALESRWGEFRYNVYILIAYVAALIVACIQGSGVGASSYIGASVFLAFAYLYPNFRLYLFFILPVKIKWLALLTWIMIGLNVLTGGPWHGLMALASVANFLVFFGLDILRRAARGRRRMGAKIADIKAQAQPFHTCAVCGATEKSHPQTEFRVCSKCRGGLEYCEQHINAHEHA